MKNIKKIKKLLSENRSLSTPEKEALLKEHNLTKKKYYQLLAEQDSWDILNKDEFGEPIQLWKIDKTSGDCTLSGDFEGFYICLSGEDGESVSDNMSDLGQDPFDEYTINYNHAQCCNPYDLIDGQEGLEEGDYSGLNTINNFMFFLNGGCGPIDEGVNLNYLNDPSIEGDAGGFNYYYAQDCPSCLPDEFPGAPYDVPPNVIDGNNFPTLPSNGGHDQLKFIQDGSCIVSACNQKYWDNYFCTIYPQLCGAGTNNCNGSCAVWLDTLIESVEDDDSCFYDGCTTVPSDLNYVCTLYPALCPGTSAMMDPDTTDFQFQMYGDQSNPTNYFGIPGGYYSDTYIGPEAESLLDNVWSEANVNGTFNQVEGGCVNPPSFGCTNNIFTNYNQDADGNSTINNIDDGSCYWEGCAEPKLAYLDEYVCNTPSGAVLCPDGETYNDEYQDGLNTGLSYTATAGDAFIVDDETTCPLVEGCTNPNFTESYNQEANWDNGSCVYTGCLDNTKPNYICNAMPSLCDQQGPDGVPLQTYTGITSEGYDNEIPSDIYLYIDNPNPDFGPLVLSNPDACGEFGCMDSGEMGQEWWGANYAGQDNGGLGALPDDYPGFQPGNYNELATEDDGVDFGAYQSNFLKSVFFYTGSDYSLSEANRKLTFGDPYKDNVNSSGSDYVFFGGVPDTIPGVFNLNYHGYLQEIKYHFHKKGTYERLFHSTLKKHALEPFMYAGNDPSSSFDEVVLRLPLGSNDLEVSSSFHPNEDIDYLNNVSSSLPNPVWEEIIEDHYLPTPDTVGISMTSEKVRIDDGVIDDNILSPFEKKETSTLDRQPPDFEDLGIYFSPSMEMNEDIIYTLGSFRLDDYIGSPLPASQSADNYTDLTRIKDIYFKKVKSRYNYWAYIKQIQYIDHTLFKLIEQFVPFRANTKTGLLIEPHYLERTKIPRKHTPSRSDGQTMTPGLHQHFEIQITSDYEDNKLYQVAPSNAYDFGVAANIKGQWDPGSYVSYHSNPHKFQTSSKGSAHRAEQGTNGTVKVYDDYIDPTNIDPNRENQQASQAPIKPFNPTIGKRADYKAHESSVLLGNAIGGRLSNRYYKYKDYYMKSSSLY